MRARRRERLPEQTSSLVIKTPGPSAPPAHDPAGHHSPQPYKQVYSDTRPEVAGTYTARGGDDVPAGFARVCSQHGWDEARTWGELNGGEGGRWYKHEQHDGYIYHNKSDGEWWIDGPDGCVRGPFECSQWRALDDRGGTDWGGLSSNRRTPTPTAGLLASAQSVLTATARVHPPSRAGLTDGPWGAWTTHCRLGVYKGQGPDYAPMGMSTAWRALDGGTHTPSLAVFRA